MQFIWIFSDAFRLPVVVVVISGTFRRFLEGPAAGIEPETTACESSKLIPSLRVFVWNNSKKDFSVAVKITIPGAQR